MKVIVAGSRIIDDFQIVKQAIELSNFNITQVVSGGARGADKLGEIWARINSIDIARFPADWNRYGKAAGYIRNEQMAKYADALVVIIVQNSRGSTNMLQIAKRHNLKIYMEEYIYDNVNKYTKLNIWKS